MSMKVKSMCNNKSDTVNNTEGGQNFGNVRKIRTFFGKIRTIFHFPLYVRGKTFSRRVYGGE